MFRLAKPIYPILFSLVKGDPENAHKQLLNTLTWIENSKNTAIGRQIEKQLQNSFCYQDDRLKQSLWGLKFANPLGLAAGFDKDGQAAGMWADFGFGFAELGAVTLKAQIGNPRPRLFRLQDDRAALNRMGANNLGAAAMAKTLQSIRSRQEIKIPIGINLCKSKVTPLEAAAEDYLGSFKLLKDRADYFVVNVSSPNTPGLRTLQAGEQLEPILAALQQENQQVVPILIKISPDLELDAIAEILNLAKTYQLAGVIATNTTTKRVGLQTKILAATGNNIEQEAGGISGLPIKQRSTEIIRFIWQQTQGKLPIVGVGGIFNAEDAWEKITAGASLLQVYTGWVYEGPSMVRQILEGLGQKLANKGISTLSEAVGLENDC